VKEKVKHPWEIRNMSSKYSHSDLFLDWAEVFHIATKRHFLLAITGEEPKRHRRSEIVLRRLSQGKKLRVFRYGKKLVYALPRKTKKFDEFEMMSKINHGLACTECLVRFYRSGMDGEIIAERFFRGCGSVPEWGIRYPNKTMLLCEFSTKSNFLYTELMNGKLNAYIRNLTRIEEKFQAKAIVVFVVDLPRATVERFVGTLRREDGSLAGARDGGDSFPLNPFFFTDYETFLKIPLGKQLYEPIYFWSYDGKAYPLRPV
jgi:hypothetical protein